MNPNLQTNSPPVEIPRPDLDKVAMASRQLLSDEPSSSSYPEVMEYLTGKGSEHRHLSKDVLQKYGVGAEYHNFRDTDGKMKKELCITFPWMSFDRSNNLTQIHRVKVRSFRHKHLQKLIPAGGEWGRNDFHSINPIYDSSYILNVRGISS